MERRSLISCETWSRKKPFGPSQDEFRIARWIRKQIDISHILIRLTRHDSPTFLHAHTHTSQVLSKNILRRLSTLRDQFQSYQATFERSHVRLCIYVSLFQLILWERCCMYCIIAALSNTLFHNQWLAGNDSSSISEGKKFTREDR